MYCAFRRLNILLPISFFTEHCIKICNPWMNLRCLFFKRSVLGWLWKSSLDYLKASCLFRVQRHFWHSHIVGANGGGGGGTDSRHRQISYVIKYKADRRNKITSLPFFTRSVFWLLLLWSKKKRKSGSTGWHLLWDGVVCHQQEKALSLLSL